VVDSEVTKLCRAAFSAFGDMKARLSEHEAEFKSTEPVFQVLWSSLLNARYGGYLKEFGPRMSETLVRQMKEGAGATGEQVLKAIFARTETYRQIQGWLADVDVLVTPTIARTAIPIDHDFFAPIEIEGKKTDVVRRAWYPYTMPFNLSGHPAISLPAGFHSDGLPVAIQLIARHGEDALLLKVSAAFERARPWAGKRPKLPEIDGKG
jgi:aspartyl-tRNA(Asn)/glutamyl-tRNA(Gln) amidotransferase subunit A